MPKGSRCIDGPGLPQDGGLEPRVQRDPRDQVHGPAEDLPERIGEILDLPAEPNTRTKVVKQVDVAQQGRLAAGDGTEDEEES